MSRYLAVIALCSAMGAQAAILTDNLGTSKRVTLEKLKVTDSAVWDEYGLADAETGRYEGKGVKPFTATAWRLKDPTGAQAAFRWLRPADSKPGNKDALFYSKFAVENAKTVLMTHGNYLIRFDDAAPALDELKIFLFQLPKLDQSSLPPVIEYLPKFGMIAGTDRFINGPASLEKFYPRISPSAVGFHFGTEAMVARYKAMSGSEVDMALFYYPTNPMARERQAGFQKVQGAMVKRTGPLLAMIVGAQNPDDAERLLSLVNYKAQVTINSAKPGAEIQNAGDLLISIFQLIGVLLAIAVMGGIMMFLMRRMRTRLAGGKQEDPMTLLHLEDRQ